MKINHSPENNAMFRYTPGAENLQKDKQEAGKAAGGISIQGFQLNLATDPIALRKQQAMKDAMDIVRTQFGADSDIDEDLTKRRVRIAENKELAKEALKEINAISGEQEKLKETFGIEADSQEQKDLELRLKVQEFMKPGSDTELTEEEWERYRELGPATEYQQAYMSLEAAKAPWQEDMKEAQKVIAQETKTVDGIEQELLKHHGMVDANEAKDKSLQAASKEIVGMMMQEGADNIKEQVEDAVEKGEAQKEEQEELEELREEQKEEQNTEPVPEELPDLSRIQSEVKEELQKILEEQKLLLEDLKGITVNNII